MKAFLMHRGKDFELDGALPWAAPALIQDLEMERLFTAMALDDSFLFDVAQKAVLSSLTDPQEIVYRQDVLRDCMEQASVVRQIYALAVEAIQGDGKIYRSFFQYPDGILRRSIEVLELFIGLLKKLRAVAAG